jgi:hypothetical protein
MPTERDYMIGALMGEGATEDDVGMARIAEVLLNRSRHADPARYGRQVGADPLTTIAGQLFAKTGKNAQFSSAYKDQSRREGSEAPYHRLMASIFSPEDLSDADKVTYDRAASVADAFMDPNSAQYGMYNGVARGADYFDTGAGSWAKDQGWDSYKHGGHTFYTSENPFTEWALPPGFTTGPLMETPSGGSIWDSINKLSPGLKPFSGEQISMMDLEELRLRNTDPTNAALQEGGQYDRSPPPAGSMGFDSFGRTIWNNYVQDDAGSWVAPGQAGAFGDNAVDAYGRQVWKGLVQDDHGNWVTPSSAGALDTGSFDVNGRQVWHGYVQGNDGGWYLPGTAGAYAAGALDSGGRTIYDGYVQDDAGTWVRPGTAGVLQVKGGDNTGIGYVYDPGTGTYVENTGGVRPTYAPGAVDALGREIFGGYVQDSNGLWIDPATSGPVESANNPNNVGALPTFTDDANNPNNVGGTTTAPNAADLNGFDTAATAWSSNNSNGGGFKSPYQQTFEWLLGQGYSEGDAFRMAAKQYPQQSQNDFVNAGGIVPGTGAALEGGLTAQDAAAQWATYQDLQSRYAYDTLDNSNKLSDLMSSYGPTTTFQPNTVTGTTYQPGQSVTNWGAPTGQTQFNNNISNLNNPIPQQPPFSFI